MTKFYNYLDQKGKTEVQRRLRWWGKMNEQVWADRCVTSLLVIKYAMKQITSEESTVEDLEKTAKELDFFRHESEILRGLAEKSNRWPRRKKWLDQAIETFTFVLIQLQ